MEGNKITIHQAFYGEVGRAHSCIKQTVVDPDLTSFLINFTDRPAALPPGITLLPYLSGSSFSKYYIFTKTIPDRIATRAGMVFTHALILNLDDIFTFNNLHQVLSLFVQSLDNKTDELKKLEIEISDANFISNGKQQPKYIQQTIGSFIAGITPILFSGEILSFSNAIQQIWNSPNIDSRRKLKFRTSFTPSDIENVNDLTIVSIQKDFLPKWQGRTIINDSNQEIVEITSQSELLFLGHKENESFTNFLVDLNVSLEDVQSYGQYERIFNHYKSLEAIADGDFLRQDIRILSKLSPSKKDGKIVKEKIIGKLNELIRVGKDSNIKALRNIEWTAFQNGEEKAKTIVFDFVAQQMTNEINVPVIAELLNLACNEERKNWWHFSIQDYFKDPLLNYAKPIIDTLWKLLDYSEQTKQNVFSLLPTLAENESRLRASIPADIKEKTARGIATIVNKRKWFLLHADLLLKYLDPVSAIKEQLLIEESLELEDSIGVKYLSGKLTPEELIRLTLDSCNPKLIELSIDTILKNSYLLKDIDLFLPCWLKLWVSLVLKTKEIFYGLSGKEQAIVFSILDIMMSGGVINHNVFQLISETEFSDISEYKRRDQVWKVMMSPYKEKFLASTTQKVLNDVLAKRVEVNSIESEITDRITSDSFMTKFLSEHRNDFEPVITLFSKLKSLKDSFLADYIKYYTGNISEVKSRELGDLVKENSYFKSARSIYDKAKYNSMFIPAYYNCKEIVTLNWWESIWGSSLISKDTYKPSPISHSSQSAEQETRKELSTVVILTAINEEYAAVRSHLKEIVEADQNDTSYEAGIFEFNGREIAKIIIRECGIKNTIASQETERAIQYFKPDIMLFVGIAGSRKPNDFSIGDVIFPEKIYSYEGGKSEKDSFVARPDLVNSNYTLYELAKKERRKDDWKMLIKGDFEQKVKADLGVIASGEKLVEHYESEIGKILTEYYNDTSAVEMEGFGFAKAASRQGRQTSKMLIGVVRGISDIIEQSSKKNKEKNSDRRPTNAKNLASNTAAAFAFWLILKISE